MKSAALDPAFHPELLAGLSLARPAAGSRQRAASSGAPGHAEHEPVCWRSEAFAEDLAELQPAAPKRHTKLPPLLQRALATVLRR